MYWEKFYLWVPLHRVFNNTTKKERYKLYFPTIIWKEKIATNVFIIEVYFTIISVNKLTYILYFIRWLYNSSDAFRILTANTMHQTTNIKITYLSNSMSIKHTIRIPSGRDLRLTKYSFNNFTPLDSYCCSSFTS